MNDTSSCIKDTRYAKIPVLLFGISKWFSKRRSICPAWWTSSDSNRRPLSTHHPTKMIRGRMAAAPVSSTTLETDSLLPLTKNMAGKPQSSSSKVPFSFLVTALVLFSLGGGYFAGLQPINQWRFFSWHPLLMTCGMVGCFGVGAVTKKLGGYTNTKVRLYGFPIVIYWRLCADDTSHSFSRTVTRNDRMGRDIPLLSRPLCYLP